jgi:serine/threonine protein phosphatase PrpC
LETPNKHHWQEALALASLINDEKKLDDCQIDLSKQYYVATCVAVLGKLRRCRCMDAVQSGCTVLSIFKQGDLMIVANAGDSRLFWAPHPTTAPSRRPAHHPPETQPAT